MKKVWKIVTNLTPERNAKIGDDCDVSPEDDRILLSLELESVDELEENGFITAYAIGSKSDVDVLTSLLYKYEVAFSITDVTKDVLIGKYLPKVLVDSDYFKTFIIENLTPDIVLDKISEMGIDSLSEIDKLVLENI